VHVSFIFAEYNMSDENKPWETEPDYEYFAHRGVECVVARMPDAGHLNGYIALPDTHPWFGRELAAFRELNLKFLYPITYAQEHAREDSKIYVVGFDTASFGYCPKSPTSFSNPNHYFTFAEVLKLTKELAEDARGAGKVGFEGYPRTEITMSWNYPWNIVK
jgi:hypothetical protein